MLNNILEKMRVHKEEIVRNTASFIRENKIPIYIIGKDITKDKKITLRDSSLSFHAEFEKLDRFAAATYNNEIFIQDFILKGQKAPSGRMCSIVEEGYQKPFSDDDVIYCMLAHETNHIINRKNMTGSLEHPTYGEFFETMHYMKPEEKLVKIAKDEYHAYKAAQGNIFGMKDSDIRKTIELQLNLKEDAIDWHNIDLNWNLSNEI